MKRDDLKGLITFGMDAGKPLVFICLGGEEWGMTPKQARKIANLLLGASDAAELAAVEVARMGTGET